MTTRLMSASAEEMLAATAHELRLPLSHIKGFVSSLRRTDIEWDEQTRREFMAEIDLATDRLSELVDSLLAARSRRQPGSGHGVHRAGHCDWRAHSTDSAHMKTVLFGSTCRQLYLRS